MVGWATPHGCPSSRGVCWPCRSGPCGEAWLKILGAKVRGGPHTWCTVGGGGRSPPCTPPPGVACSQAPHSMHWGMPHGCRACLWAQLGDTRHLACTATRARWGWGRGARPGGAQQLHHAGPSSRPWALRWEKGCGLPPMHAYR